MKLFLVLIALVGLGTIAFLQASPKSETTVTDNCKYAASRQLFIHDDSWQKLPECSYLTDAELQFVKGMLFPSKLGDVSYG